MPDVSVLLISWNTRDETRRCLDALVGAAGSVSYEVIAVDNASTDGSAQMLAADPCVRLIRNPRNLGFAQPVNQAYAQSRGGLVLLLNSDVEMHTGALQTMVTFLREHPDVAGVSPLYLNPDGSFQQHYVQLPSLGACMALWTPLKRVPGFRDALHRFQRHGEDFSQPRELASASCLLIRRHALGTGPIFDESFPVYWNDAVLIRELNAAGHRLWMTPDVAVTHARGASCRLLGPAIRFRHLLGGMVRYLQTTHPPYRLTLFRVVLSVDYLVKTALGRTTPLGWRDLRAALRGDVGPLPDGDARDWEVLYGPAADLREPADNVRRLIVAPPGRSRSTVFAVEQTGPTEWQATLPTTLPFGRFLPVVRWLNERLAAARLRRWLDAQAGGRLLRVDRDRAHVLGWLGEDMNGTVDFDPMRELVNG